MKIKDESVTNLRTLSEKEKRGLEIYELIRKRGSISRNEISKLTHINIVSVSSYVKNFIDKGLASEKESDVSTGGRRPEMIGFNVANNRFIGIDVKAGQINGVLVDLALNILKKGNIEDLSDKDITGKIIGLIEELAGKAGLKDVGVKAAGIGTADMSSIQKDEIEKKTGIPAFVSGDVLSAALAEKTKNAEADTGKLLYMHSDLGYGVIIADEYYFGATSGAGPIQIPPADIIKDEKDEFMEKAQYLRPWGESLSIVHLAKNTVSRGVGTRIVNFSQGKVDKIDEGAVVAAAKEKDDVALDLVQLAAINIGLRASYLINLFNPTVCVVGGGLEKAGTLVLEPIRKTVKRMALSNYAKDINVILSISGEDAVSLGAASFAIRETFINA